MKKIIIYGLMFFLLIGVVNAAATYYNYWVEDSTHMWIKFNTTSGINITFTINNGTNQTGYNDCGTCVFPVIFDDFNDNSFNTSMWCNYGGGSYSYSESGGIFTWTSTAQNGKHVYSCSNIYGNYWRARRIETNARLTSTALSSSYFWMEYSSSTWTGPLGGWGYDWNNVNGATIDYVNGQSSYAFSKSNQYDRISVLHTYSSSTWRYDIYRDITTSLVGRALASTPTYNPNILAIGSLYDNGNYNAYNFVGVANILNATPTISCSSAGSTTTCNVTPTETGNDVTYVFTGNFNTAGNNKVYTGSELSITIQSPTPSDNTLVFMTNNSFIFNTTSAGFTGSPNITQNIYYSNGTRYDYKVNVSENISNTFTLNYTGVYYYNATVQNSTTNNISTETRSIEVYNLTNGTIISPTTGTRYNLSSIITINYTSANSTTNRTNITYYNISLLNSDGTFNKTIAGNVSTNLSYNWNSTGVTYGSYKIRVMAYDNNSQNVNFTSGLFTMQNQATVVMMSNISNLNYNLSTVKWLERNNASYYSYITNQTNMIPYNQSAHNCTYNITAGGPNITVTLNQNISTNYSLIWIMNGTSITFTNTTSSIINTTPSAGYCAKIYLNLTNALVRWYYNTTQLKNVYTSNIYDINITVI